MAIAIRGTSPGITTNTGSSATITLVLNGTRQPQTGDVLVIIHCNNFYGSANMPTPTVGGSTTGVNAISNGTADAGASSAHVKSYSYVAGSTGDLTVAVTETGTADEEKALIGYVLSGADTAAPIDVAGNAASGSAATPWVLPTISPASADAYLIGHVNTGGGSSVATITAPGSMSAQYDSDVGGLSYGGAIEQLSASGATGTRTFTPSASTQWGGVLIAVKTAAAGSAWTYGFDVRIGG